MNRPRSGSLEAIRNALFFFWPLGLLLSVTLGLSGQSSLGLWIFFVDLTVVVGLMMIYIAEYDETEHTRRVSRGTAWPITG